MSGKVGFVGLGLMGRPMARNLISAGHDLVLYNRTRQKAEELATETGADVADSAGEVARVCDVTVTMLPAPPDVERVVAGEDGILENAATGDLLVDMSTSSPVLAREMAASARERGIGMLDAPVSGGDVGAIEGTLSIMVGGEEEDFERARPLFDAMGKTVTHVGGPRRRADHEGGQPGGGGADDRGGLRGAGARVAGRGLAGEGFGRALWGFGRQQGHGAQAGETALR